MVDVSPPQSGRTAEPCRNLRRDAASQYLLDRFGVEMAVATLAKLACIGGGPPFYKCGRKPLYPTDALDAWAEARLGRIRSSTSDDGRAA